MSDADLELKPMPQSLGGITDLVEKYKQMTGRESELVELGPEQGFRPGTKLPIFVSNYVFAGAGIGDFICYMPAMLYIAKHCAWIRGRIWVIKGLHQLFSNIMRDFPDWKICDIERINYDIEPNTAMRGPGVPINGRANHPLFNGTGGHLVTVGFANMVNKLPGLGEDTYPWIDFNLWQKTTLVEDLGDLSRSVVFTPGGTTPSRTVPGSYWNPIIKWCHEQGLRPIFIGRRELTGGLKVCVPGGIDTLGGVDLIDKTSIMEAAYIMAHSLCMTGLDNGMIHLASCTEANIIAAYNIVKGYDRRASRPWARRGKWIELENNDTDKTDPDYLPCAGCQSKWRQMAVHSFRHCMYSKEVNGENVPDLKCTDLLFRDGGARWINAITKLMLPD